MTAEEAASLIKNGEYIGISGFTLSGYPKAVPEALALRVLELRKKGGDFKVSIFSGASAGDDCEIGRAHV